MHGTKMMVKAIFVKCIYHMRKQEFTNVNYSLLNVQVFCDVKLRRKASSYALSKASLAFNYGAKQTSLNPNVKGFRITSSFF